ncbi:amyloid-beta precursor protein [Stomoxys calcitrans]|uniref:amyloid-beta precursor protein n=1 Tax=Stomoxys calcitrans TaxID=35570 RepID=UPI0027E36DAA|nr:amyloid-beta precursor protein [Stomoxys calcitrans]XP_013116880.2 amyloid-beta precursor protein [Stomoxys calcitrans]
MNFGATTAVAATVLQFLIIFVVRSPENFYVESAVGLYGPDRYEGLPETCLMPMDFGYCRAKLQRYYFDIRRMKCTMFYWGGCAGNDNNFKSMDECNDFCSSAYENTNSVVPLKRERSESNAAPSTNVKSTALNSRGSSISKPSPPKFAVKSIPASYRDNASSNTNNSSSSTSRSNSKTFNVNPPQKELKYPSNIDDLEEEEYDE